MLFLTVEPGEQGHPFEEQVLEKIKAEQMHQLQHEHKNITIEVKNSDDALKVARTDINTIILNRFEVTQIKELKKEINKLNPRIRLAVSGGITGSNVTEYAKSGADMLISSWPYYADPSDLSVIISPIFDY